MKYQWIQHHHDDWPIDLTCRTLRVSRSGYYAWRKRPPSDRTLRRKELLFHIRSAHEMSRKTYGSPRIHRELEASGMKCNVKTVACIMRENAIKSVVSPKFKPTMTNSDHQYGYAPNVLNREFDRERMNDCWVSDITYIPTREGWSYLAVVLDLYSRRVIGYAMADHLRSSLAIDALSNALEARRDDAKVRRLREGRHDVVDNDNDVKDTDDADHEKGIENNVLLHHSDRGVQYAGDAYRVMLEANGLTASMSRRGNCYDNAVVESFFGTLKMELVYQHEYATKEEAMISIEEYIENWYNTKRRHSSLGYVSPAEYERLAEA